MGTGIMLRNNELKDIIRKVKHLENGWILLKETTEKIRNQEGEFLANVPCPLLLRTGLLLMKSVLTPMATIIFVPLALPAAAPVTVIAIRKKIHRLGRKGMLALRALDLI